MKDLQQTLMDLIQTKNSVTGYEMEQIVKTALNSVDDEEAGIAEELSEKYFGVNVDASYKPLKFVHYRIVRNREGEYSLRRNLYMSPRATGYFSVEYATEDRLRDVVRTKKSVLGSELKEMVHEAMDRDYMFPNKDSFEDEVEIMSYYNLSKQLAQYIYDYFINCEKSIKDDIYYGVSCKEYATATIYRDVKLSPRQQNIRK